MQYGAGLGTGTGWGGARAVVLTLGSVLNVKQLLLKSLLLFLLNVKTQKQCFSVNVEQLYTRVAANARIAESDVCLA